MSAYRYVVFPRGVQPTAAEVRQLEQFAGLLANHFAWGVSRDDGRLALVAELAAFDHARQIDAGFDALVHAWVRHGCELLEHLKFVKDAGALKPVAAAGRIGVVTRTAHVGQRSPAVPAGDALHNEARLAAKQLVAQEAVAQSLLGVDRTMARYAAFGRFAAAIPYVLIALAVAGTIAVGLFIRSRLSDGGRESRQETIEQMVDAPAGEADNEQQDK
jgi:hypothetical protein